MTENTLMYRTIKVGNGKMVHLAPRVHLPYVKKGHALCGTQSGRRADFNNYPTDEHLTCRACTERAPKYWTDRAGLYNTPTGTWL